MKVANLSAFKTLIDESSRILKSKNIFTKLKNFYHNHRTCKILSPKLNDFSEYHFDEQIKIIYEDTRSALQKKEFPIMLRSIVNFQVN